MLQSLHIDIGTEGLAQMVHDIFETMLAIELEPDGAVWVPARDRLAGAVYLTGSWNGAVLLECDYRQACAFTTRLMPIPASEIEDGDVRDTMGELANMIGGNLKSVLPRGVTLSMPSVVEGNLHGRGAAGFMERMAFRWSGGVLWVTLIEAPIV